MRYCSYWRLNDLLPRERYNINNASYIYTHLKLYKYHYISQIHTKLHLKIKKEEFGISYAIRLMYHNYQSLLSKHLKYLGCI